MVLGFIFGLMAHATKANSKMAMRTAMAQKLIPMAIDIRGFLFREKSKARVFILGKIVINMRATGIRENLMAKVL